MYLHTYWVIHLDVNRRGGGCRTTWLFSFISFESLLHCLSPSSNRSPVLEHITQRLSTSRRPAPDASGAPYTCHIPPPSSYTWNTVWELTGLTSGASAGVAAAHWRTHLCVSAGGRERRGAATLLIIHNVGSKSVKREKKTSEDRAGKSMSLGLTVTCNVLHGNQLKVGWAEVRG